METFTEETTHSLANKLACLKMDRRTLLKRDNKKTKAIKHR